MMMDGLRATLAECAADIYPAILGEPNRALSTRRELRFGRRGSISVALTGSKAGLWHDHENDLGGDVIALLMQERRIDFRTAVQQAGEMVRIPLTVPPSAANDDGAEMRRRQRIALEIWEASKDPAGTPVEAWLRSRGLDLPDDAAGRAIRFHPYLSFAGQGRHPAMVALFIDIRTNEPRAIHRTALTKNGGKAAIECPRLTLGPCGGAAIKLSPDEHVDTRLAIGEGVETTLAGMALGFTPAWAVGNAGGLGSVSVLAGIEALSIFVDNDFTHAGQRRARLCSERWTQAGREVFRITPNTVGADLNDVAKARLT
jgi:putative DNA primase/helicase